MNRKVELYENQNGSLSTSSGRSLDVKDKAMLDGIYSGYGFTSDLEWMSVNSSNTIVDKLSPSIRFSSGIYNRLGEEILENNLGIDGLNGWGIGNSADVTINNGEFKVAVSNNNYPRTYRNIHLEVGEWYLITVEIDVGTAGTAKFWVDHTNEWTYSSNGTYEVLFYANESLKAFNMEARTSSSTSGIYSIFKQPSIKKVQSLSTPLKPFASGTTDEVISGLSSELIVNGTLDNPLGAEWVAEQSASLTRSSGKLIITNNAAAHGSAIQTIPTVIGDRYEFRSTATAIDSAAYISVYEGVGINGLALYESFPTSSIANVENVITFTATTTQTTIRLVGSNVNGQTTNWDNISVKRVESQLQCKQAHKKGDFVVTGKELVTNGTFDTNTSGWIAGTLTSSISVNGSNQLEILSTAGGGMYGSAWTQVNLVEGETYILFLDIISCDVPTQIRIGTGNTVTSFAENIAKSGDIGIGLGQCIEFVADADATYLSVGGRDDVTSLVVDNISLTLKDSIKQATRDTADMFDIQTDTSTTYDYEKGKVYKVNSSVARGTIGNYYLCINDSYPNRPASSTYFDNDLYFIDLGTAENMDLRNPYFENRDAVTRQDIVTYRINKTTKAHDFYCFKGTKYYDEQFNRHTVMKDLSLIDLGQGLFEDNTYEYIFVGLLGHGLNAGAYHPMYNFFGAAVFGDTPWDDSQGDQTTHGTWDSPAGLAVEAGVFNSFYYRSSLSSRSTGTISDNTPRVDGKYYDKIYTEGVNGIISQPSYANGEIDVKVEADKLLSRNGLECGVKTYYTTVKGSILFDVETYFDTTYSFDQEGVPNLGGEQTDKVGYVIGDDGTVYIGYRLYLSVSNRTVMRLKASYGNVATNLSIGNKVYYFRNASETMTYGENFTIDKIGNPDNDPSDWKAHLASGKVSFMNYLLVGQNGDNYTGTISSNSGVFFSKDVASNLNSIIYKATPNSTWSPYSNKKIDSVTNISPWGQPDTATTVWAYETTNIPASQSNTIYPILEGKVDNRVFASNRYNNRVIDAITGGVATSDGNNGLEQKTLENALPLIFDEIIDCSATSNTVEVGKKYLIINSNNYNGYTIIRQGSNYTGGAYTPTYDFSSEPNFTELFKNTSSHPIISLDNSDSKAGKWFSTLAVDPKTNEYIVQVFGNEMKWDFDEDSRADFTDITSSFTSQSSIVKGTKYHITDNIYEGFYIAQVTNPTSSSISASGLNILADGSIASNDIVWYKKWDGNGFGDDTNSFEQLTNGSISDTNGNLVKTKVLSYRTGKYKRK